MLADVFIELCFAYNGNTRLIEQHWRDISEKYSDKKRHYHNLDHLSNMLVHLQPCRELVVEWNSVLFALFYHDYIYNSSSKDNEEESAIEAERKLTALGIPIEKISLVTQLILATKSHTTSNNNDVNLFTDADLSILGSSDAEYESYRANVRKEYSVYPDLLYKPGRRKVLQHFLDMPYIFKTEFFRGRLEAAARKNISNEIKTL